MAVVFYLRIEDKQVVLNSCTWDTCRPGSCRPGSCRPGSCRPGSCPTNRNNAPSAKRKHQYRNSSAIITDIIRSSNAFHPFGDVLQSISELPHFFRRNAAAIVADDNGQAFINDKPDLQLSSFLMFQFIV